MARQGMASLTSKSDPWSDDGLRETQKEDPDVKAIPEFKESSSVRPTWLDISTYSPVLIVIGFYGTRVIFEMEC